MLSILKVKLAHKEWNKIIVSLIYQVMMILKSHKEQVLIYLREEKSFKHHLIFSINKLKKYIGKD